MKIKSQEQNNIKIPCFSTCQGSSLIELFSQNVYTFDKTTFHTESIVLALFGFLGLVLASSNTVDFALRSEVQFKAKALMYLYVCAFLRMMCSIASGTLSAGKNRETEANLGC